MEERVDGTVSIGLKRMWADGTRSIELSPLELVEKLAAIVPPPCTNTVVYHGVLAGHAAWRKEIVPKPPPETPEPTERRVARKLRKNASAAGRGTSWAEILARVFHVDGWRCPECGQPMRLRANADDRSVATPILRALGCRGPPVSA